LFLEGRRGSRPPRAAPTARRTPRAAAAKKENMDFSNVSTEPFQFHRDFSNVSTGSLQFNRDFSKIPIRNLEIQQRFQLDSN
jgi:hypothetical protein